MLGALAAVVPALGADGMVTTVGSTFSPATVTINAGEQVTFQNGGGGNHDLQFDDRAAPEVVASTMAWTVSRRFDQAGRFGYRCNIHVNSGMVGEVVVNAAPTTQPPGATPPPPGTTPPPGDTPPPPGGGPPAAVAPGFGARLVRDHFCTRRSATCKRPGIGIRLTAQEDLAVTGSLERRPLRKPRSGKYRPSGRVRFAAAKGGSSVNVLRRVDGSRIGVGDYRLTLTGVRAAPGSDGTRSAEVVLRFFVRR
jgi:plastocyanin